MFGQIKDGGARDSGRMKRDAAMTSRGGAVISWKIIGVSDTIGAGEMTGVVWKKTQSGHSVLVPVSESL
jgi:hypothetical protein